VDQKYISVKKIIQKVNIFRKFFKDRSIWVGHPCFKPLIWTAEYFFGPWVVGWTPLGLKIDKKLYSEIFEKTVEKPGTSFEPTFTTTLEQAID
jgi:hypothetical protein